MWESAHELFWIWVAFAAVATWLIAKLARRCDQRAPTTEDWTEATDLEHPWTAEIGTQRRLAEETNELWVVSYNLHGGSNPGRLAAALREAESLPRIDVMLVQEVHQVASEAQSRASVLAAELGLNYAYAPARLFSRFNQGVALLSRWPMRDMRVIELKRWTTNFRLERRIALAARMDWDGQDLLIINVHLDVSVNADKRLLQMDPVFAATRAHPGPVLVGGDVNTNPFLWLERTVPIFVANQRERLARAARAVGLMAPTLHLPRTHITGCTLDSLYVRGLDVEEVGVDLSIRLSDHYPIWMRVRRPGG